VQYNVVSMSKLMTVSYQSPHLTDSFNFDWWFGSFDVPSVTRLNYHLTAYHNSTQIQLIAKGGAVNIMGQSWLNGTFGNIYGNRTEYYLRLDMANGLTTLVINSVRYSRDDI
jgi:hypothetical protein